MNSKSRNFWDKQAKSYDTGEKQFDPVYRQIITRTKDHLQPMSAVIMARGNVAAMDPTPPMARRYPVRVAN